MYMLFPYVRYMQKAHAVTGNYPPQTGYSRSRDPGSSNWIDEENYGVIAPSQCSAAKSGIVPNYYTV